MAKSKPTRRRRRIAFISIAVGASLITICALYVGHNVSRLQAAKVEASTTADEAFRTYLGQHIDLPSDDAEFAWQKLLSLAERVESASERMRAMLAEQNFPRRDSFDDPTQPDWQRVTSDNWLAEALDPERLAIRHLRESGVFDHAEDFARRAPALRPPKLDWGPDPDEMTRKNALRSFSSARTASLRLSAEAGDWEDVTAGFETLLAVNHTLLAQSDMMLPLVGIGAMTSALTECRHLLREYRVPSDARKRMLDALDRFSLPPATVLVESGRADWQRMIDAMYTRHLADGDGYFRQVSLPPFGDVEDTIEFSWRDAIHSIYFMPTRHELLALSDTYFERCRPLAALSQAELRDEQHEIMDWIESRPARYELFQVFAPTVLRLLQSYGYLQMDNLSVRIMLALEAFRDDHGAYPDSLEELVPDYLAEISTDPLTGQPFGYRRVSDDPIGRGYLLYSWGSNLTDNGGRESADEWTTQRIRSFENPPSGFDYILNHPRTEFADDGADW